MSQFPRSLVPAACFAKTLDSFWNGVDDKTPMEIMDIYRDLMVELKLLLLSVGLKHYKFAAPFTQISTSLRPQSSLN